MKTPGDPRDTYLAQLDWIDAQHGGDAAAEPAAEPERLPAGRRAGTGARDARVFRDDVAGRWVDVRTTSPGSTTAAPSCGSASATAGGTSIASRATAASDAAHEVRRAMSSTSPASTTSAARLYFLASPANATQRYLYRAPLDGTAPPQRVTPDDSAGNARLRRSRRTARLAFHTYSTFDRPPIDGRRVAAGPSVASAAAGSRRGRSQQKVAGVVEPPDGVLHRRCRRRRRRSTAG